MKYNKAVNIIVIILLSIICIEGKAASSVNIDSLKKLLFENKIDSTKQKLLFDIAYEYFYKLEYDSAILYCDKTIQHATEENLYNKNVTNAYFVQGTIYYRKGEYEKALKQYDKAIETATRLNDKKNMPILNNAIGSVYKSTGNYPKAIEYYQNTLKVAEEIGDSLMIGNSLNNIANVYYSFGIFHKSIEFYNKASLIYEKIKQDDYLALTYNNLGISYRRLKDYNKSLDHYLKSQNIFKKTMYVRGLAQVKSEIGGLYSEMGNLDLAIKYLMEAYEVYKSLGEQTLKAQILQEIGISYKKLGNYSLALDYLKKSLELEKEMSMTKEMIDNYRNLADVYGLMGNYRNAYENVKIYSTMKDTLLNNNFMKQMQEMEAKYENTKKEKELQLKNAVLEKKDIEAKRKNVLLIAVGLITLMVIAFSFVLYRQFTEKKKANILLAEQNDEIKLQRDQIFQQKKEITDSIHYASRIQRAVLPSTKLLEDFGLQYFILYKPRDIVSGDFFWINQKDNKLIIAAADCTGHGVPGAFMSMLGMALLNEIVSKGDFNNAAQILDQLRNLVVKSLHQSGKMEETKDGMDMALCMVDTESLTCQFAGAFNPLYVIRGEEIIEGAADRMPVGFHDRMNNPFTNTEISLQKGDRLYIFSDGYVDQFGGESGKKFMAKKFKQLLVSLQEEAMESQRDILDKTIVDWRGELDQVDDILVIGLKV